MRYPTRYYNTIKSPVRGTINKISNNSKLVDEYDYYVTVQNSSVITEDIKVLFPRATSLQKEVRNDETIYTMTLEYIPIRNLFVEMLNNKYLSEGDAAGIQRACAFLSATPVNRIHSPSPADYVSAYRQMYIEKTETEYRKYIDTCDEWMRGDIIKYNGIEYKNFHVIWDEIKERFFIYFTNSLWTTIHGDLCLSNILFEQSSGIVKFVDMRGSFGRYSGTHGDIMYDYAKLYHSLYGLYEWIIYDRYEVKTEAPLEVEFPQMMEFRETLIKKFFSHYPEEIIKYISAIAGTIFIGMCHRHAENPEHQKIMYCQGVKLLNESLAN